MTTQTCGNCGQEATAMTLLNGRRRYHCDQLECTVAALQP